MRALMLYLLASDFVFVIPALDYHLLPVSMRCWGRVGGVGDGSTDVVLPQRIPGALGLNSRLES